MIVKSRISLSDNAGLHTDVTSNSDRAALR